jgi:hypothetical protein
LVHDRTQVEIKKVITAEEVTEIQVAANDKLK